MSAAAVVASPLIAKRCAFASGSCSRFRITMALRSAGALQATPAAVAGSWLGSVPGSYRRERGQGIVPNDIEGHIARLDDGLRPQQRINTKKSYKHVDAPDAPGYTRTTICRYTKSAREASNTDGGCDLAHCNNPTLKPKLTKRTCLILRSEAYRP